MDEWMTVVHIHPKAIMADATSTIAKLVHRLQSISPDVPYLILGDFNSCCLKKTKPLAVSISK